MELWDKEGNFLGSVDKAKKVLAVISDEERWMLQELKLIQDRKEALKKVIEAGV